MEAEGRKEVAVTWETSREATTLIVNWARAIALLPLRELAAMYQKADSLGAVVDPTGYREHMRSYQVAARIVGAAQTFAREVEAALKEG